MATYQAIDLDDVEPLVPADAYVFMPEARVTFDYRGVDPVALITTTTVVDEYVWIGPGGQPDNEHAYWG